MVQDRNVTALKKILQKNDGRNVVIGTHGTALSSISNHYDSGFNCDSFLCILDWMPYIIELDFENGTCTDKIEHLHIKKGIYEKIENGYKTMIFFDPSIIFLKLSPSP